MYTGHFDKAVAVETAKPGQVLIVRAAEQAARFLLQGWPDEKRNRAKYKAAKRACLEVLEGHGKEEAARKAFAAAARDAGILIRTEGF